MNIFFCVWYVLPSNKLVFPLTWSSALTSWVVDTSKKSLMEFRDKIFYKPAHLHFACVIRNPVQIRYCNAVDFVLIVQICHTP